MTKIKVDNILNGNIFLQYTDTCLAVHCNKKRREICPPESHGVLLCLTCFWRAGAREWQKWYRNSVSWSLVWQNWLAQFQNFANTAANYVNSIVWLVLGISWRGYCLFFFCSSMHFSWLSNILPVAPGRCTKEELNVVWFIFLLNELKLSKICTHGADFNWRLDMLLCNLFAIEIHAVLTIRQAVNIISCNLSIVESSFTTAIMAVEAPCCMDFKL